MIETIPAGEYERARYHEPDEYAVFADAPDERHQAVDVFVIRLQVVGHRDEFFRLEACRHHAEVLVQRRHQQCVVGKRKRQVHGRLVAVGAAVFQRLDGPVLVGLRIAVEPDAFGRMIAGIRIDEQEGMRAALERGAGDEPGLEDRLAGFRLRAPVDQVQAGAVAGDCAQEPGQQVLMARRGCLRDDNLPVADAEVREFESIGVERAFAGFDRGVIVGTYPGEHVHRQPRTEQMREGRQPVGREIICRLQRDGAGDELHLQVGEYLPVETGEPGIVHGRIVAVVYFQVGDPHRSEQTAETFGILEEHLARRSARFVAFHDLHVGLFGEPRIADAARNTNQYGVVVPGPEYVERALDPRSPFRRHFL